MFILFFIWIISSILITVPFLYTDIVRFSIFIIAYVAPLLLSKKAMFQYNGYDIDQNKIKIYLQRLLFITLSQSIPLASLFTLSIYLFTIWLFLMVAMIIIMRSQIKTILLSLTQQQQQQPNNSQRCPYKPTIGLYHPHAHQRAGGEMVLWRLIHALQLQSSQLQSDITIFSNIVPKEIIQQGKKMVKNSRQKTNNNNHNNNNDNSSLSSSPQPDPTNITSFLTYLNTLSETTTASVLHNNNKSNQLSTRHTTVVTNNNETTSSLPAIQPPEAPIDPIKIPGIILDQVESTFGIDLHHLNLLDTQFSANGRNDSIDNGGNNHENTNNKHLYFEFLSHTALSDSHNYPRLTLILQTLNSIYPLFYFFFTIVFFPLSFSGRLTTFPSFILDTSGYPITSLLCWVLGIPCGAYVHYPIIQKDMIERNLAGISTFYTHLQHQTPQKQQQQQQQEQNELEQHELQQQKQLPTFKMRLQNIFRHIKHYYFCCLYYFYVFLLSRNEFLLANGTWTFNHLYSLLDNYSTSIIPLPPSAIKNNSSSLNNNQIGTNGAQGMIQEPIIGQKLEELIQHRKNNNHKNATILGRLYPPCNVPPPPSQSPSTQTASLLPTSQNKCQVGKVIQTIYPIFISLGQYRPEKQQLLLLDAFISLLQYRLDNNMTLEYNNCPISLFFIGTYRPEDINLIKQIINIINTTVITPKSSIINGDMSLNQTITKPTQQQQTIKLSDHVKCFFNVPLSDLNLISNHALGGLHAMIDEHFGIAVVELLAKCYTIIGHQSAGPALDIIVPTKHPLSSLPQNGSKNDQINSNNHDDDDDNAVGYTASTCNEYSIMMNDILILYEKDLDHVDNNHNVSNTNNVIPCNYSSPLLEMSLRGKVRAYNEFSLPVFDQNVENVLVPLLRPYVIVANDDNNHHDNDDNKKTK